VSSDYNDKIFLEVCNTYNIKLKAELKVFEKMSLSTNIAENVEAHLTLYLLGKRLDWLI